MSFELAKFAQQTKMTAGMRSRSSCKAVFNALAHFADDASKHAYPCVATLVAYTELSKKAVTAALDELEKFGFITDTTLRAGRTKQVKVFTLTFLNQDNIKEWSIDTPSENKEVTIEPSSEDKDESNDTPLENERGSDCHAKGVGLSQKEGSIVPTIKSVNKSLIKSSSEPQQKIQFSNIEDQIKYCSLADQRSNLIAHLSKNHSPTIQALLEQIEHEMNELRKPNLKVVRSA